MLLRRSADNKFTLVHLFGGLFVIWSATSLIWTPNKFDGTSELIKLVILAQAFVYGSRVTSISSLILGLSSGLLLSTVVLLLEPWWPDIVLHSTDHAGLFVNSGSLAEISALVLIGLIYDTFRLGTSCVYLRQYYRYPSIRSLFLIVAILPCIILPESRGAWLALAAAFTTWLWSKSKLSALALIALTGILITYSFHIGFHTQSVVQRLAIWQDAIGGMTWLGHGIGSFWTDYAPLATAVDTFLQRPEHLHNDWLEIVFEGGFAGAALFACFIVSAWCSNSQPVARAMFAGFAAEALVDFPLHNPATAFVAALCLGHLARNGMSVRDAWYAGRTFLRTGTANAGRAAGYQSLSQERSHLPA